MKNIKKLIDIAKGKNLMSIIDKLNDIDNIDPISPKDISDALKRSASALKLANDDLDKSISLITDQKI